MANYSEVFYQPFLELFITVVIQSSSNHDLKRQTLFLFTYINTHFNQHQDIAGGDIARLQQKSETHETVNFKELTALIRELQDTLLVVERKRQSIRRQHE